MAHVRTQIRRQVKAVLDQHLPTDKYRVFASRKTMTNHLKGKGLVDIRFLNDQTQQPETQSDDRVHIASLYIRVQRTGTEDEIDDALDEDEVLVIRAMEEHDWCGDLLEDTPELTQVNFSDDAESGRILGGIILRFDMEYRIDKTNPEQTIK